MKPMIPDSDMDTDYDHPDVVISWTRILAAGFWGIVLIFIAVWGLVLLPVLTPVCGAALLAMRLRTLALRALGRPAAARPTLEELAGHGGGP
jgi:hypothetical protein